MLKYILLGFICQKPSTGYELKQALDKTTGYFWHAYHSQVYTTLRNLEKEGLITTHVENGSDHLTRRVCRITDAGQAELLAWQNDPLMEMTQMKEDLMVRVFFSSVRATPEVEAELRMQRKLHEQQLQEYLNQILLAGAGNNGSDPEAHTESAEDLNHIYQNATLRFGIAYERMYLEWLDDLIGQLEKV
jgi:DNA-binding PadR family transcriptional regulator